MTDVVIVNLPKMLGHYLPAAPALLKGACNYLQVNSRVLDFNTEFLDECKLHNISLDSGMVGITTDNISDPRLAELTHNLVVGWAEKIAAHNPKVVAISVFSYYGRYFANQLIRAINLNCKIVIGGAGIKDSINDAPHFAIKLKEEQLIDDYIVNDGESAFPELIAQYLNLSYTRTATLDIPYYPDYSDYDLEKYQSYTSRQLYVPVTGSRGCVRHCNFCEIHEHWRFQQRSAEHIVQELRAILKVIDNPHFHFTDSLVNGSLKEFNTLLDLLIVLKEEYTFTWGGQFIIREQAQFDESYWKKIGLSNAQRLEIGIETGSEELRYKMNKPFTNAALDFSMQMMEKYSITCVLLFIVGFPLETDADFAATLDLLEKYKDSSAINSVQLGHAMAVMPGTPLSNDRKSYGLVVTKNPTLWMTTQNPTLTFAERLDRRKRASAFARNLGYKLSPDDELAVSEMEYNLKTFQTELKILGKLSKA
jgi:hypothetical protein